jgi:hypothetical protein
MAVRTLRWIGLGGLALGMVGIVVVLVAGGWAATGIGTNHSGTTAGVIGAMITGWGFVLAFTTWFTSLLMRKR